MDAKEQSTPPVGLIDDQTTFTLAGLCRGFAVEGEFIEELDGRLRAMQGGRRR